MQKLFPVMMDRPEKGSSFAALVYGIICFASFPFLILFFMQGLWDDPVIGSWCEIVYHGFNLFVIGSLYRNYLSDTLFDAQINWKKIAKTVAICAAIILGLHASLWRLSMVGGDRLIYAVDGMLPTSEMDILWLSSAMVINNPLFGTLCMVFVTPFVISLIYYASAFAPICCERPWLAYPVTALVLALPRVANAMTFFDPGPQIDLYLIQLPVHMIACWAYQKTDNIWTPIVLHAVVNLFGCLFFLYHSFFVWV